MVRGPLLAALALAAAGGGALAQGAAPAQGIANLMQQCRSDDIPTKIRVCSAIVAQGARVELSDRALAHHELGNAHRRSGDTAQALRSYDQAIKLTPRWHLPYNGRGLAHVRAGDTDRAIVEYGLALQIDPRYAPAYANRAEAYRKKKDFTNALADHARWLELAPKAPAAYFQRGLTHTAAEQYDAAIADFTQALTLDPAHAGAFRERGIAHRLMKNYALSLADLSEAVRLDPNAAGTYLSRSRTHLAMGDQTNAFDDINRSLNLKNDTATGYVDRAHLYNLKRQWDLAIADLDYAISAAPTDSRAFNNRGFAYVGKGDFARGIADYQEAIRLDANNQTARNNLAQAIQRRDQALALAKLPQVPPAAAPVLPKLTAPAVARPQPQAPAAVKLAPETRVALVIGNSNYAGQPVLANPVNDAKAIAGALTAAGFTSVTLLHDMPRERMIQALRAFEEMAEKADWAVVYFAGHGMEMGGTNYLIPTDARLKVDRDLEDAAVPLDRVLRSVNGARKMRLVILDACRNNPFNEMRRTLAVRAAPVAGLGAIEPIGGTLVAYAAKHGQVAHDGRGGNSPFVAALVKRIGEPRLEINKLFRHVRDDVLAATGQQQEPFLYGSLPADDFFFRPQG